MVVPSSVVVEHTGLVSMSIMFICTNYRFPRAISAAASIILKEKIKRS